MLADRYFVRRLVGEGAMGRVYEGHHTGIGKRVAIKIPRHGERRKSELLARFRLEAQAASQIRHPNIADVTDCASTPDGRFFFVMEYVDGVDLGHLVRRQGPLPIERSLIIAVQVCRAIEAAHKAGIIHRDLKPSNVMLLRDRDRDRDDRDSDFVKVLDFGVAKFLRADVASLGTDLSRAESAVGTPKYMAPEQIERGNDIDFRVDIYALGGLIYFMLSGGHAPIEGETVENVWRKKVTEEATPLGKWRSDLPPTVDALVMRCLARDPGRRPVSMEILRKELLASIERLRQVSSSVLARAPSSTSVVEERGAAPARSGRSRAATVLMLGLGGGIVGGLALLVDRAADPGPTPALVATERAGPAAPAPAAPAATAPSLPPAEAPPAPESPLRSHRRPHHAHRRHHHRQRPRLRPCPPGRWRRPHPAPRRDTGRCRCRPRRARHPTACWRRPRWGSRRAGSTMPSPWPVGAWRWAAAPRRCCCSGRFTGPPANTSAPSRPTIRSCASRPATPGPRRAGARPWPP